MTPETYYTAKQCRTRFCMSESGMRNAVKAGAFPSPIKIMDKQLWPLSRLNAWEQEQIEAALKAEQRAKSGDPMPLAEIVALVAPRKKMGRPLGSKNRRAA